jgi:hypothetical protein
MSTLEKRRLRHRLEEHPPALGATVSIGGPWSHTRNGITCQFSGVHDQYVGQARAFTTDSNGLCANLRVRLKYRPDNVIQTSDWWETTLDQIVFQSGIPATTIASEHRAKHPSEGTWSSVQRPHAF